MKKNGTMWMRSGEIEDATIDRGYQGQCWSCGKIGHKSSECRWGVDNVDDDDDEVDGYGRRSGDQSESEKGSDVGGSMDRWECGGDRRRRSE